MNTDVANRFLVGALGDTIVVGMLSPRRLTREEALNLAAWLLALADRPVAFEHVQLGAVVSYEFFELLKKIQST